jgi:hypothetical protein
MSHDSDYYLSMLLHKTESLLLEYRHELLELDALVAVLIELLEYVVDFIIR